MGAVKYGGFTSGTGPSPEIWGRVNVDQARVDPSQGYEFFDDFLNFGTGTEASDATAKYDLDEQNAMSVLQLATEVGGVIQMLTGGTAEDAGVMTTSHNIAVMAKIVKNSRLKMAFEARVRFSEAVTGQAFFIGLAEQALGTASSFLTDSTGALVAKDYVGFRILAADPNGLDAVHYTESGAGSEIVVVNEAQVISIATWYKAGFWFDGKNTIHFVVDGVEVGTCSADDTDFPDGEEMSPYLAFKETSGTAEYVDMDWWRVYASRIEGA